MKILRIPRLAIPSFLLLFLFNSLHAQETSTGLNGRITDTAKHALPSVTIVAIHKPSGTRYTAITDRGWTIYHSRYPHRRSVFHRYQQCRLSASITADRAGEA